jgi:hypothetical protein
VLCRNGGGCVGFFGSHVGSKSLSARLSRITIHHSAAQELQADFTGRVGEGEGLAMGSVKGVEMTAGGSG